MNKCYYCGKEDEIGHYVKPDYHRGLLWLHNCVLNDRVLTCKECADEQAEKGIVLRTFA